MARTYQIGRRRQLIRAERFEVGRTRTVDPKVGALDEMRPGVPQVARCSFHRKPAKEPASAGSRGHRQRPSWPTCAQRALLDNALGAS